MFIDVTTIGDLLDRQAASSDGDAVVFPDERRSYRELAAESTAVARSLRALGVGPRDHVGILMGNRLEYVLALLGVAKLGAVAVPINGRFKAHELTHVVAHGDIRTLLCSTEPGADYPALLGDVFAGLSPSTPRAQQLPEAPALRQLVDMTGARPGFVPRADFDAAAEAVTPAEIDGLQRRVRVRDIALLMYTSGTTARPKGCLLTHEAIVRQASAVAATRFRLTEADALWDPLPLFHCGGIVPMLGCFSAGATYVHAGHFDAGQSLAALEGEGCTVAYPAFETIWNAVLNHPDFPGADLSRLRLIQNIATPERLASFERRMPWAAQVTSYGSTECATNLTLPMPDDPYEVRMETLGSPVEGMEIRIVDPDTRRERPTGEVGELAFRGYAMFEGYYKDPQQTQAAIDADGWFHTGDLATVDADGRMRYAGRLKDMLKVGGENVAAIEIEDFIARHEAVDMVAVVAAPDARYGEVPAAFVQVRPHTTLLEEDVVRHCLGQIATYKVPRYVRLVEEWPMSGTKVQKFVLRDRIAAELAAQGITEAPPVASTAQSGQEPRP